MTAREWIRAAACRRIVELVDGGTGTLMYVRPNGTRATVQMRPGVFKSVPVAMLKGLAK